MLAVYIGLQKLSYLHIIHEKQQHFEWKIEERNSENKSYNYDNNVYIKGNYTNQHQWVCKAVQGAHQLFEYFDEENTAAACPQVCPPLEVISPHHNHHP